MSREIKFEYGFESVNGIVKKVYRLHEIPDIAQKCDVWGILPIRYIREFSGILDKNGKEIYEDDVIHLHKKNCVMEFIGGSFGCRLSKTEFITYSTAFEIIGNIYENPELLTKK